MGHQGGKIADKKERAEFIQWLDDLEYKFFGLPKPDINIFLKTSPRISQKLSAHITDKDKISKKKSYLGNKKKDLHEKDIQHLEHALNSYIDVAKMYPKDFAVIDCFEEDILLPPEVIHARIWRTINQRLGIVDKVKSKQNVSEKINIFGDKEKNATRNRKTVKVSKGK
jgi:dTMP kinase